MPQYTLAADADCAELERRLTGVLQLKPERGAVAAAAFVGLSSSGYYRARVTGPGKTTSRLIRLAIAMSDPQLARLSDEYGRENATKPRHLR